MHFDRLKRREFIALLGGAAAWPLAARGQQGTMPVVGFVNGQSADGFGPMLGHFRQGLKEMGYAEGQNVVIEPRWAEGQPERLPALVGDLLQRQVAVFAATGGNNVALAAKKLTSTIPIVFTSGDDPRRYGLVESFNRPGGNTTGVSWFSGELGPKRLEVLRQLVPHAKTAALLFDPKNAEAAHQPIELQWAATAFGMQFVSAPASSPNELDAVFSMLAEKRVDALVMAGDPSLTSWRTKIIELAAQHTIPTIYLNRDQAGNDGLVSYGNSLSDAYRRAGVMTGRILRGVKPAELPIDQATKFELVVNLKTAKALGLTISRDFLLIADELIE
jgi:putative ABC transport system substrate-binding protein